MTKPGGLQRTTESDHPELTAFEALYDFDFDEYQLRACRALASGRSVLLAAPTGSGKTVAGEFAVHLALAQGRKCFYTTPIKALSNQKYGDLVRRYSAARVGLLTGDNAINGEAPVVVMTTEVLRNMLYAGSPTLAGLSHVVLDEVHYLADQFRGAVWEEVIIHLPESVTLAALSATVSNAEEFGDWLASVRGGTEVIVEEHRPVPLWQHMLIGNRLLDLFAGTAEGSGGSPPRIGTAGPDAGPAPHPRVNPALLDLVRRELRPRQGSGTQRRTVGRTGGGRPVNRGRGHARLRRPDVIARLDADGLLPAIVFIFSRTGCDAAVRQCLAANLRLTTREEAATIAEVVAKRVADIPVADLAVLGFDDWLAGLLRGIAAHHAGLLPAFKEVVEELFAAGLIRAVFATETLALGVNMPARSVVIESLGKWNGQEHSELTAGEYTQLTGRAGRRGIDVEGHAVVLWQPDADPAKVAGLAGTRTYPLNSSFRPSYNMAVNLVAQVGAERASRLLESSFAQFQADRSVVGLARQARKLRDSMAGLAVTCDRGDFSEYAGIRAELSRRERELSAGRAAARRAAALDSLRLLRRGDVIMVPGGRRAGLAIVLSPLTGPTEGPGKSPGAGHVLLVLTEHRQLKRLAPADCPDPVLAVGQVRIPPRFNPRSPQHRRDLVATMRNKLAGVDLTRVRGSGRPDDRDPDGPASIAELRRRLRRHPCHGCPHADAHARQAEKYLRLEREADEIDRRMAGRSHVIARTFDRVCAVLAELGYFSGTEVTGDGRLLAGIYCELDLLTAECLRRDVWSGLAPAELAACVSALTFESRRAADADLARMPRGPVAAVLAAMTKLWGELAGIEHSHRLSFLREPDLGFAWASHAWASGQPLGQVLGDEMTPGDFVRAVKQLIDLLDQIRVAARDPGLAATASSAISAIRRGVVAYSSV